MTVYSVDIDSTNQFIFQKILYHLYKNNLLNKSNEYILENRQKFNEELILFLIPKTPLTITFEELPINITYKKTRESRNYHSREVRFDSFILISEHSIQHLYSFITYLENLIIPETHDDDLCRYVWDGDSWRYNKSFKPRLLDTIYFPEKDKIIHTLGNFLNDEETSKKYERLNIPHKKVFLFHGIPGTGKSSLIKALASHFKYHLSFVKNIPKLDDIQLESMMNNLRKNSFLVFEDIDTLINNRNTDKTSCITFGGILNMLDGISTFNKLVIFITTNRIQDLEAAFKRRVDLFIKFDYVKRNEIIQMYTKFFEERTKEDAIDFYSSIKNKNITVNSLEKFFIQCMNHNLNPIEHLKFLNDYSDITTDSKFVEHLYN